MYRGNSAPQVRPRAALALVHRARRESRVRNHLCELGLRRELADALDEVLVRRAVAGEDRAEQGDHRDPVFVGAFVVSVFFWVWFVLGLVVVGWRGRWVLGLEGKMNLGEVDSRVWCLEVAGMTTTTAPTATTTANDTAADDDNDVDDILTAHAQNTHVRRGRAAVGAQEVDTLFRERDEHHFLYRAERV